MHSYDTNFFIKKVFTNTELFNKVLNELLDSNSKLIILRSVLGELLKHLWMINSSLSQFKSDIRKTSFDQASNSNKMKKFSEIYDNIFN